MLRMNTSKTLSLLRRTKVSSSQHVRSVATMLQEPDIPEIVTSIPGPASKARMAELAKIQSMSSIQFFVDYKELFINYVH